MDRTLRHGDPAEVGMSAARIERVRRLGAEWVETGVTPALQLVVARHGVVVLNEAWGRLGPEPDAPSLSTGSIFPIASLTKPITAAAVMCLVEDGLLGLNRPVQEYVPEFVGEGKEAVMVHHLLTHTSGLRDDDLHAYALEELRAGRMAAPPPAPPLGPEEWLPMRLFRNVLAGPLSTPPGVEMSYCNFGYRLLTEIVDRVAGQPVDRFVEARIFASLGLRDSSYVGLPSERLGRLVRRSQDSPYPFLNEPTTIAAWTYGMGSAASTARDLAVLVQMTLNGGTYSGTRVLSRASVREMIRNQIPGIGALWAGEHFPEAAWGYGWGIQFDKKAVRDGSLHSPATFMHGGAGMSQIWGDPSEGLVGVYLSVAAGMLSSKRADVNFDLFANAVYAAIDD